MPGSFLLSCESTVDLPYSYVASRGCPVLFYTYTVDGTEYPDDMLRDPDALGRFYAMLADGKLPRTSQLNEYAYETFFEPLLQQGDVLHIAFGSGMTQSVQGACRAAERLREKYPERKLIVIDSLCSSSGYGLLVDYAADLRDAGRTIDETALWVTEHCRRVHHQFYSTRLDFYRRSGRMSGPAAMLGTVLGICPILRLDNAGRIVAYDKVRGKKAAVQRTVDTMLRTAEGGADYSGKCFVCHSNCPDDAARTRDAIAAAFPHIQGPIRICDIGAIIASHCGPGTVAAFYLGSERPAQA